MLNPVIVKNIRDGTFNQFKFHKGTLLGKYYNADPKYNLYQDKIKAPIVSNMEIMCYLAINPPIKTVKALNWWKEDQSLPLLMYTPYYPNFEPKKDDKVIVYDTEGLMQGTYIVLQTHAYGQGEILSWVLNVAPLRKEIDEGGDNYSIPQTGQTYHSNTFFIEEGNLDFIRQDADTLNYIFQGSGSPEGSMKTQLEIEFRLDQVLGLIFVKGSWNDLAPILLFQGFNPTGWAPLIPTPPAQFDISATFLTI